MTKFEAIKQIIENFQEKADLIFSDYNKKVAHAKGFYSEAQFGLEFAGIWGAGSGKLSGEAQEAILEINDIFEGIEGEFRKWMMKPISDNLLQTLNCIRDYGLKLSKPELEILQDAVKGSYFGSKIFSGIAKESGYFVKFPDMAAFMELLHSAKADSQLAINAYAGKLPEMPGRDLLGTWRYNGIEYGEYQTFHMNFAANFLGRENSIDRAANLWMNSIATANFELTEAEKERIKELFKDNSISKEQVIEMFEADPDLINKLDMCGSEYEIFIRQYLKDYQITKEQENQF